MNPWGTVSVLRAFNLGNGDLPTPLPISLPGPPSRGEGVNFVRAGRQPRVDALPARAGESKAPADADAPRGVLECGGKRSATPFWIPAPGPRDVPARSGGKRERRGATLDLLPACSALRPEDRSRSEDQCACFLPRRPSREEEGREEEVRRRESPIHNPQSAIQNPKSKIQKGALRHGWH